MHSKKALAKRLKENPNSASEVDCQPSSSISRRSDVFRQLVAGRVISIELENFMCHSHLKINFDTQKFNCFYIVGPNGSGKSAIFAAINMALGGSGRSNDRGNSMQSYVQEGKSNARLRIVLSNEGCGRIATYGKAIIIERGFNSRSALSQYAIRNVDDHGLETVVSKKKSDLDNILHCFNINLENPISWLSQDRSRQFLAKMKPTHLYEMFMESTKIRGTEFVYKRIEQFLLEVQHIYQRCQEDKNKKKSEYKLMRKKFQLTGQLLEKRKELNTVEFMQLWAPIRDIEQQKLLEKERLSRIDDARNELLEKSEGEKTRLNELKASSFNKETEFERQKRDANAKRMSDINQEIQNVRGELTNAEESFLRKKVGLAVLQRENVQMGEELRKALGGSNRDFNAEKASLAQKQNELEEQFAQLNQRKKLSGDSSKELESDLNQRRRNKEMVKSELNNNQEIQQRLRNERDLRKKAQLNHMAVYGEHINRLLEAIKQERRFRRKPLGPLGKYINVKNRKWVDPVEFHLKNQLKSFVCDSAEDRKLLDTICKQLEIRTPDLITTCYSTQPIDTFKYEPPEDYMTILRAIEVSDTTVYNTLIDMASIENIVIFEDDDKARLIMSSKNPPQNVKMAVTSFCSLLYPRTRNRPYRYYACHPPYRPQILVQDFSAEPVADDIERQLKDLIARAGEMQASIANFQKKEDDSRKKFERESNVHRDILQQEQQLNKNRQELERKNDELDALMLSGDLVKNIKESLIENKHLREKMQLELDRIDEQQKKLRERLGLFNRNHEDARHEKEKIRAKLAEITAAQRRLQDEVTESQERIQEIQSRIDKLVGMEEKFREKLQQYEKEQVEMEEKIQRDFSDNESPLEKPNFETIPSIDDLEKMHLKLKREIRIIEKEGKPPNAEDLHSKMEEYDNFRQKLNSYTEIKERLEKLFNSRQHSFNLLKFALPLKLRKKFIEYMQLRNYGADLQVNNEQHAITIRVDTHNRNKDPTQSPATVPTRILGVKTRNNADDDVDIPGPSQNSQWRARSANPNFSLQDLKGLSGGERSYTTACFVMALWSFVDMPFRLLDEFDVFMDMLNRRVVMGLFVDYALENPSSQSFFFTPQSIRELSRDDVQVFDLPRVRGRLLDTENRQNDDGV